MAQWHQKVSDCDSENCLRVDDCNSSGMTRFNDCEEKGKPRILGNKTYRDERSDIVDIVGTTSK